MQNVVPENLMKEEISALTRLKNRDDIVIRKADKGFTVTMVVLDKQACLTFIAKQLAINVSVTQGTR